MLDVREPDEYEQGALPGALHIPRGHLESQVEGKITDHDAHDRGVLRRRHPLAFAADTLGQLGYTDVVSMAGGFNKWKDEGRAWRTPATLSPSSATATSATCCCPRSTWPASQAAGLQGAAPRGRRARLAGRVSTWPPPGSAPSASSTWTWSTQSNLQRQILHNKAI